MSPEPAAKLARAPRPQSGGELLSIQALRGGAAMLVVVFHAASHAASRWGASSDVFELGNAGVDVFFVISGFIMWTTAARRPTAPGSFLLHRAIRLVPLYWLFTLLKALLASAFPQAFPHYTLTMTDLMLSLAFVPHISPGSAIAVPVLGQGWTLNFEVFFYLLFAAALALPARRRLIAIGCALGAAAVFGVLAGPPPAPAVRLLNPLLLEFLAGILIARLIAGGWRPPAAAAWALAAAGAALLLLAAPDDSDDVARVWQYGIPAAMIVAGTVAAEFRARFPSLPFLKLLGDASYSIYLSHTFVISVLGKLWRPEWSGWGFTAVAAFASAAAGAAVWRFVERPMTAALRQQARGPAAPALAPRPAPAG